MAVIATVDEQGQPNSSVIYYSVDSHNSISFITKAETAKYNNLRKNNKAAMTIVDRDSPQAANIEGTVSFVEDSSEFHQVLESITKIGHKMIGDFAPIIKLHKGRFVAMKFTPTKGKYTDFRQPVTGAEEVSKDF